MTAEEMDRFIAALRSGKEFRVRNMDGEWGIRGQADGSFEEWSHAPYEEDRPPRRLDEAAVRSQLGPWEFGRATAQLRAKGG